MRRAVPARSDDRLRPERLRRRRPVHRGHRGRSEHERVHAHLRQRRARCGGVGGSLLRRRQPRDDRRRARLRPGDVRDEQIERRDASTPCLDANDLLHDLCPVGSDARDLGGGGNLRHEDAAGQVKHLRRIGHRRAVVAAGCRGNAALPHARLQQRVERKPAHALRIVDLLAGVIGEVDVQLALEELETRAVVPALGHRRRHQPATLQQRVGLLRIERFGVVDRRIQPAEEMHHGAHRLGVLITFERGRVVIILEPVLRVTRIARAAGETRTRDRRRRGQGAALRVGLGLQRGAQISGPGRVELLLDHRLRHHQHQR